MSQIESKLFSAGKILGGLAFCLLISLGIYAASIFLIYAAWHCPAGNCQTSLWADITVFSLLASPFFVFATGAYLSRRAVYALTEKVFLRVLILLIFACFPLLLFAGLVIYAVNSTN